MRIPDKLKLNKFRLVLLPSTRDIFARYGQRVTPASQFTGDEEDATYASTKVETLARTQAELYREYAKQNEASPEE